MSWFQYRVVLFISSCAYHNDGIIYIFIFFLFEKVLVLGLFEFGQRLILGRVKHLAYSYFLVDHYDFWLFFLVWSISFVFDLRIIFHLDFFDCISLNTDAALWLDQLFYCLSLYHGRPANTWSELSTFSAFNLCTDSNQNSIAVYC